MRYITIGTVSSEQEFNAIAAKARQDRLTEEQLFAFAELMTSLAETENKTFKKERKRWKPTPRSRIFVYASKPIWAAIMVHPDDRIVTLLKIVDDFSGDPAMHEGLLADALDRFERNGIP